MAPCVKNKRIAIERKKKKRLRFQKVVRARNVRLPSPSMEVVSGEISDIVCVGVRGGEGRELNCKGFAHFLKQCTNEFVDHLGIK